MYVDNVYTVKNPSLLLLNQVLINFKFNFKYLPLTWSFDWLFHWLRSGAEGWSADGRPWWQVSEVN